MNRKRALLTRAACASAALVGCFLTAPQARAEVVLTDTDPWEVYTAGRVNVFFGYAFGEAKPFGNNGATLKGGGIDSTTDKIPETDDMGMVDPTAQGTISKMRFHSGFVPNVLTVGVRRNLNDTTKMKAQMSIWGTLETSGQRKYLPVTTDFREGFLELSGDWGTFTGGRFGSLFSRGITEADFLYGHGYGVGFWGGAGTYNPGPTAGLIGFGVLANSFSPGIMYTTPNMGGFSIAAGIFDPVNLPGSWETTRTARPEFEAMYDIDSEGFKAHFFLNGAFQKVHQPAKTENETVVGVGYGGRLEFGDLHLGGGGHYGQGLGLYYALEGSDADVSSVVNPTPFELRTIDGFSFFAQYVLGQTDLNVGVGQSRVHLLDFDKNLAAAMGVNESIIKTQTGISAGIVYHVSESLHLDVDYLNAAFDWYGGESESVNYLNAGVTMTW